uniref:Uncharacterized protein n=1 Tax=Sphenodon punctatus TaxID=8508 RepID=A0A8D0HR65_SPHPU
MMCVRRGRPGAEEDIQTMNTWFNKFGFATPSGQCIDPDGKEIKPALEKFRDQINQSNDDISCCLITLMSHGREGGYILGKDGIGASLEEIFPLFNNVLCPKLQQKPKVFLIQACRGGKRDAGVSSTDQLSIETEDNDDVDEIRRLPTASDYYVVYSTQKGYVSLRNDVIGSRMIEIMDQVFSVHGMEWHIGDLFTKVCTQQIW